MRESLGLSLAASNVVWTLVDLMDGTIVADDIVEVESSENVADAAAHSVETIAAQTERHIDAIRIAWTESTAGSAVKLASKLRSLGFSDIDVLAEDEARHSRNRTARYIDPPLELAYGAARTVTAEDRDRPLQRIATRLPARRVSVAVASSVMVMAVGAAIAGYLLAGRAPSQPPAYASPPVASAPPPGIAPFVAVPTAAPPPPPAPVVAVPTAAPPPPPAPEASMAPPVALTVPSVEAAAPTVSDESQVGSVPQPAAPTGTAPAPVQAASMARQPRLAAEAPAAGSVTVPESAQLPDTATAPASAPATMMAGQPHLTPEALSARLLPGPVPPTSVVGVPAPLAVPLPPPPVPNPLDILAALP